MKSWKKMMVCSLVACSLLGTGGMMTARAAESVTEGAQAVHFQNGPWKMAGNLYLPKNMEQGKKYPAIITVHPGGGVKEQTSGLYARKLAEQGFITLAYDASHQGESEGVLRYLENPTERVEDIRSAVDYLTTLPQVDTEKIGVVGICAGGGFAVSAAQTEHRIKAVATASAVDIGTTFRQGWNGKGTVADQLNTLNAIAKQRTAEAGGAEPMYTKYVPEQNEITADTEQDMKEASDYYRTPRGQHPNAQNKVLFTSFDKVLAFNAFSQIDTLLTQPVLFVVGTEAGSRWQSEMAYEKATSPKEMFLIEGATHMDLYDISKYVDKAVVKMADFFHKQLGE